MMKYLGEGLSAFDKIAPAFEKEVNKAIKEGLKQVLSTEPTPRDKEIEEVLRQEKEDYKTALEYISEAESLDNSNEYKFMYSELVKLNRKIKN